MIDLAALHQTVTDLRQTERGVHGLELARRLGVPEVMVAKAACGRTGPSRATELRVESFPELLAKIPALGTVKAITRNAACVSEILGTYGNVEFFGAMGQSVSSIDLRIFTSRWRYAFALEDESSRGLSRSLQFFDAQGAAVHKLYVRERTDLAAYDRLVDEHRASDPKSELELAETPAPTPARPDTEIDVDGLRAAWRALEDTHAFHMMLRKFEVGRTQALRLAGADLATPVAIDVTEKILLGAAEGGPTAMIFVGNPGMLQIWSGHPKRVVRSGDWLNVLDPGFSLHLLESNVTEAWVVRKPTKDGVVTSLELYSAEGESIALLVGKRYGGEPEQPAWRALLEGLVA